MKTLFLIAALACASYLILQTPVGKSWLHSDEAEPNDNKQEQLNTQISQLVADKLSTLKKNWGKQQDIISQLEDRIAELETERTEHDLALVQTEQPAVGAPTIEESFTPIPQPQGVTVETLSAKTEEKALDRDIQRNRQARLQDIAARMEMSSLEALVN